MLRLFLTKHFSSQAYRPLRPLLADKTLIYETDPSPKPNVLLYQIPGLLLAANNFLTEWTWMSSGAFALAMIAGNVFFFQRLVKWTSGSETPKGLPVSTSQPGRSASGSSQA